MEVEKTYNKNYPPERIAKLRESMRLRMLGNTFNVGRKLNISAETRRKKADNMREIVKNFPHGHWAGKKRPEISGEKHYAWKGGSKSERDKDMASLEYKMWRKSVFERDNYTCVLCGDRSGKGKRVVLNADHIKQWAFYPDLRHDLTNGRTLCKPCHLKQPTHGRPKIYKSLVDSELKQK